MNGNSIIDVLQLISAFAWVTVMAVHTTAALRIVRVRPRCVIDFYRTVLWGIGAVQAGFVLRWALYPSAKRDMLVEELTLWGSLYVSSALIALATHWLPRRA